LIGAASRRILTSSEEMVFSSFCSSLEGSTTVNDVAREGDIWHTLESHEVFHCVHKRQHGRYAWRQSSSFSRPSPFSPPYSARHCSTATYSFKRVIQWIWEEIQANPRPNSRSLEFSEKFRVLCLQKGPRSMNLKCTDLPRK
jgi:hypothetical protein